jgi:hypothetical protein
MWLVERSSAQRFLGAFISFFLNKNATQLKLSSFDWNICGGEKSPRRGKA